jgi:1-acyl-sn-glycerol-3-phosphate acyltransferase
MPTVADTFYPPQPKPLLIRLIQSVSTAIIHYAYHFDIEVSDDDIAKLRALDQARLVYICNHPTLEDGVAIFGFSARVGQLFHYIVARESFKGLQGKFLQAIGCYSIRRGLGDRASITQTLTLLKAPKSRLVIFPEGGCSYQNDTVMPFRSGAIQMPLQVMAQLAKLDPIPDLYLVPVSLKYRYTRSMQSDIETTLHALETRLHLSSKPPTSTYERLRQVAQTILLRLETEYGLASDAALSWNQRIQGLRDTVIADCEQKLQIAPIANLPLRERVYKVQAMLETDESGTPKDEKLYWTTVRLLNFDAIYDGYVAENPTPERFLDTLMRLEREVYQHERIKPKAYRKATIKVGEPINMKDYVAAYQKDKSSTVEHLTEHLQMAVQDGLHSA